MGLATVKTDIAPLYMKASAESQRIDEVLYGESVQIMQESEAGWCYMRTEHGTEGYAFAKILEKDAEIATAWRKYEKITVLAPYIDVQAQPNTLSGRVVSVPRGGILVALGEPSLTGWQKVGLTGGEVGYTRASYIGEVITDWTAIEEEDLRWNIVETALAYNGTAFRAGGRTPLGIDSLGLVAMCYALNGVNIAYETTLAAGNVLHRIDAKRMSEGDVLFFAEEMGIYIGDDKFIHATDFIDEEGVLVNSLNNGDEDYRPDLASNILGVGSIF